MSKNSIIATEPDSASAVGIELDTIADYTTDGANLLSVKNAGSEVFAVNKDGVVSGAGYLTTVSPSDGGQGIRDAIVAADLAGGGIVQLLNGTYVFTDGFTLSNIRGVTLRGMGGSTILQSNITSAPSASALLDFQATFIAPKNINNTTAGNTSVFLTTPGDAVSYKTGMTLVITGNDPSGIKSQELNTLIADGNPSSGELLLNRGLSKTLTSVTITAYVPNYLKLENFQVQEIGTLATNVGIRLLAADRAVVKNIQFMGLSKEGLRMDGGTRWLLENVVHDYGNLNTSTTTNPFVIGGNSCVIRQCRFTGANDFLIQSIVNCSGVHNFIFEQNIIQGKALRLLYFQNVSGDYSRSIVVKNNHLRGEGGSSGIEFAGGSDNLIINNTIQLLDTSAMGISCSSSAGVGFTESVIMGNIIRGGNGGIRVQNTGTEGISIINNHIRNTSVIGIQVNDLAKNVSIVGNRIDFGGTRGIDIVNASLQVAIVGNVVSNCTTTGGIALRDCDVCSVYGNLVRDTTVDGITVGVTSDNNLIIANKSDGIDEVGGTGNLYGLNMDV